MVHKFKGYRRDNGMVGVRNHVIILPVDDLSNAACKAVANNIAGTMALPHPYGRLQFGEDLELHFKTLIGAGSNPNVAAVVVIGIEPIWAEHIAKGISATGKPVAYFGIENHGDLETIRMASQKAKEFVHYATTLEKVECDLSELIISFKCGESDTTSGLAGNPVAGVVGDKLVENGGTVIIGETPETTGGEHVLAKHFISDEVAQEYLAMHKKYMDLIDAQGADLLGSQPTQGNIAGGLTTIEEKITFLHRHQLALWDVLQSCEIQGADDASIKNPIPNDFTSLLQEANIKAIFTTGKKATDLYMKHCYPKTNIPAIGLPSSSPANRRISYEKLKEEYSKILEYLIEK